MTARVVPISSKLREADRLKAVLQAMPVAVSWASLDDGRIEFTNRRFDELFGYRAGHFKTVFEFHRQVIVDPDTRAIAGAGVMAAISDQPHDEFEYPAFEMEAERADGEKITVLLGCLVLPQVGAIIATTLDITAQKDAERLAWRLANEDPLTGLPNRRAFDEKVAAAIERGEQFGVFIFDLDGFKRINDSYGHRTGDAVLKTAAQRLRSTLRASDIVSRWGGDEFAALLGPPLDPAYLEGIRQRLLSTFCEPIHVEGNGHRVGISAGYAVFPGDGDTADGLTSVADHAMYEEKRARATC